MQVELGAVEEEVGTRRWIDCDSAKVASDLAMRAGGMLPRARAPVSRSSSFVAWGEEVADARHAGRADDLAIREISGRWRRVMWKDGRLWSWLPGEMTMMEYCMGS